MIIFTNFWQVFYIEIYFDFMSLYIFIFTIDVFSSTGRIYLIAQETFQFLFLRVSFDFV